jgi:hypothetical protein
VISTIYISCLLLLLVLVTLRGAMPERLVVWILFVADVIDLFYHRIYGPSNFTSFDLFHFTMDSVLLVALLWVALGANRFWPLPICSLHLIGFSGHIGSLAPVPWINGLYWAMATVPAFLQLPIVLAGVIAHIRRTRRIGHYRDWRHGWRVPSFVGFLAPSRLSA